MKKLLLLPLLFLAILISLTYSSDQEINRKYSYVNVTNSNSQASANDAIDYNNNLYKDVITGKVEHAKLAQAKDEVLQKMRLRSTSLGFVEEGPDNVGG